MKGIDFNPRASYVSVDTNHGDNNANERIQSAMWRGFLTNKSTSARGRWPGHTSAGPGSSNSSEDTTTTEGTLKRKSDFKTS